MTGDDAGEQRKQVRVLVRAVNILDRLSESRAGIGVSDLARTTGLSKATVHNILETLVATGLALPDPVSKRYLLGSKPATWGRAFLQSVDIGQVALDYLDGLRDATGETVTLFIRSGDRRVCAARAVSMESLRQVVEVGFSRPLWQSATGRVLMSGLADDQLATYLARADLQPSAPNTLTDRQAIHQMVRETRQRGYALAESETYPDVGSVAVPVHDHTGSVIAALAVSGPSTRWNTETIKAKLPQIMECARELSRRMGRLSD